MRFCSRSALDQKLEFVRVAQAGTVSVAELCRRYGIGRTCGHRWLARFREAGEAGLTERSRRPLASPGRTAQAVEAAVLGEPAAHPAWGGRKIARVLARELEIRDAPCSSPSAWPPG